MDIKSARITLIDDDYDVLETLTMLFELRGFTNIKRHSSGEKFFEFYKNSDCSPPDIVYTDLYMPGMSGFEVLKQALQDEIYSRTIFIAISGYLDRDIDTPWLKYIGFDAYVDKSSADFEKIVFLTESLMTKRNKIICERNPYKNLIAAIEELSKLQLRSRVLENDYIKKLISPEVFKILDSKRENLAPKHQEIAVGFVDIRDFTQLMNSLQIQQVNKILELFFQDSIDFIIRENGFIDKFIGDEVMWFHQSSSTKECTEHCIDAAIDIIKGIKKLNIAIQGKLHLKLAIKVGIGIACGIGAVGIYGDPKHRIQYSVLGPPVNLAARLCKDARGGEILIGGEAIEYCVYKTRKIGFRIIKGFDHEVEMRRIVIPQKH